MNCSTTILYWQEAVGKMAYIEIHKITKTLNAAFKYGQKDKSEQVQKLEDDQEYVRELKEDLDDALKYIEADKNENTGKEKMKEYKTVSSGIGCTPETAFVVSRLYQKAAKENRPNRRSYSKNGQEVVGWHCIQSFAEAPNELSVEKAHEIGLELAKKMFGDFPCVVSTHCNTENIHNHIIFGAWNAEGKKWNQCNSKYQEMRSFSDELCEKNGLHVLQDTKKVKLVKWRDDNGQIHYYEPTKRKDAIRSGEFANANDYRNTSAFEETENHKKSNRQTIKEDIDALLPVVQDYEDLLFCLRNIGYEIKDKRKDGSYMKHISFKPQGADKATRDYKISEDGFYTRENLEDEIMRRREMELSERSASARAEADQLDGDFREDGKKRGALEKDIVANIKADSEKLDVKLSRRTMYYIDSISAGFEALHYVEMNHIDSLDKVKGIRCENADRLNEIETHLTPELLQKNQDEYEKLLQKKDELADNIEKADHCIHYISRIKKSGVKKKMESRQR